jgi:predicted nucleotidyltransferase
VGAEPADGRLRSHSRHPSDRPLRSALREDFRPDSDIDLLVEFQPGDTPGLVRLAQMELELEDALGRQVELRTPEDLSPYFRDAVTASARPVYAV